MVEKAMNNMSEPEGDSLVNENKIQPATLVPDSGQLVYDRESERLYAKQKVVGKISFDPEDPISPNSDRMLPRELKSPTKEVCDKVVERLCDFLPEVDGQEQVSPLVRKALSDMIYDVAAVSYIDGICHGWEQGFWDGCSIYGHAIGDELEEEIIEHTITVIQKTNDEFKLNNGRKAFLARWALDGGGYYVRKLPSDAIRDFSQKRWMSWREGIAWLRRSRDIAGRHQHISKVGEIYAPEEVFVKVLELSDLFDLDAAVGITYFCDAVDLFAKHNISIMPEDAQKYREEISVPRLESYRSGVPLDAIFL